MRNISMTVILFFLTVPSCLATNPPTRQSVPFQWVGRLGDTRFAHDGKINSILPLPNGKEILSCSRDGGIRLWDLATGKEIRRFTTGIDSDVSGGMVISPDGKYLTARGGYLQVFRWDFKTGKLIDQLNVEFKKDSAPGGDNFYGIEMAILPGGSKVLVGYGWEGKKGHCVLWDIPSGKRLHQWSFGNNKGVEALCPLPDKKAAWIGAGAQAVKLDLTTGKELKRISFPVPEFKPPRDEERFVIRAKYQHGLIQGMALVDDGRSILIYRNRSPHDSFSTLIDAKEGAVRWDSKKHFPISRGRFSINGPWALGSNTLLNVRTQERKKLPDGMFASTWSADKKSWFGFYGNRIYGYDVATGKKRFPHTFGRPLESYVGINKIYLLDDEKQVLIGAGYPGFWWALWDRKTRRYILNEILQGKWRRSYYDGIRDVDEASGKVTGIARSGTAFVARLDQPFSKAVELKFKSGYSLDWFRFGPNSDQVIGTWSHGKTTWVMWDVHAPEKQKTLPTPMYMVRSHAAVFVGEAPPSIKQPVPPKFLRLSADRTRMVMASLGWIYRPDSPDVKFWSFPAMKELGALNVKSLVEQGSSPSSTDLLFSRRNPNRLWIWRKPPQSSTNAWWKGEKNGCYDGRSTEVIPPRLELREKSNYTRKAMGEKALGKWVEELGNDWVRHARRKKAAAVLESIHADDIPLLAKFQADPKTKVWLENIQEKLKRRETDYRLRAAADLPITVELLAEHPDGRHVLIYGYGKFPAKNPKDPPKWNHRFLWLRFDPKKGEQGALFAGQLRIVRQFQLPLAARSLRFASDGELLIGTAAGTVELYRLPESSQ